MIIINHVLFIEHDVGGTGTVNFPTGGSPSG